MKNKILSLILIIICQLSYSQNNELSYSQNNESNQFDASDLIGVWHLKFNRENDNLTFEKKVTSEHKYGSRIEILETGEFYNRYSAPCGNDGALFTHNYNGKWSLNEEKWIITTSEPINRRGTVYEIVDLQSDKLILAEIKTE